jgi:hypothetical protein
VKGKSNAVAGIRHSKVRERRGDATNSPERPAAERAWARLRSSSAGGSAVANRAGRPPRAASYIMRNSKASERNDALRPRAPIPYFMAPGRGYRPDHHLRSMKNVRNSSLRTKSPS